MGFIGVQPASVPLTASDITNDIINADKIADNSISEEHLDPTVITGLSALGAEPADTDELLISDAGTLKRMDYSYIKGGGGFVRVGGSSNTSAVSAVTLDGIFTSTYKNYKIIGHIGTDQSTYIKYRTRASSADNNGDQYINSERYNFIQSDETQSTGDYGHHTTTFGFLAFAGIATNSDVTGSYCGFDLTFYNPLTDDSLTRHMMTGQIVYRNAGTQKMYGSQVYSTATANHNADGIKFETNAGNVHFHRIDVYGMVNS